MTAIRREPCAPPSIGRSEAAYGNAKCRGRVRGWLQAYLRPGVAK